MQNFKSMLSISIIVCCLLSSMTVQAQNLLKNGSFDIIGSKGHITHDDTRNLKVKGVLSAAKHWSLWTNTRGIINSEVVPSTLTGGQMMKIETYGKLNGLVQVFGAKDEGEERVEMCAWIFIEEGEVGIGAGNRGNTHTSLILKKRGTWERVMVSNGVSPANAIRIYSQSDRAVFYVESVSVVPKHGEVNDYCCMPE